MRSYRHGSYIGLHDLGLVHAGRGPSAVVTVIVKHGLVLIILALDTTDTSGRRHLSAAWHLHQYSGSCLSPAAAADDDGCTEGRQGCGVSH